MLVDKTQLSQYNIPNDLYFARRYGSGEPLSRDQFFLANPARLSDGIFCAIGNDESGWELEQFNGVNWNTVLPDPNYSLIITNEGLNALTQVIQGGYQLYFSGIKVLNNTVLNPSKPIINWTDRDFTSAGNVVFSIGTSDAKNCPNDITGLNQLLKWQYNTATGSLQYTFDLPNEGIGAKSDQGASDWSVGAFGIYVKTGNQYVNGAVGDDVLFGVASLPSIVAKYGNQNDMVGNTLRFHFNTVLNNLGYVANLDIVNENEYNIPQVPNETLLQYPYNPIKRPYNCYLVDNLYGSGMPALAVPRTATTESLMTPDWVYFQPSDNILNLPPEGTYFANDVEDYMFVYWCAEDNLYHKAEGEPESVAQKEADSMDKNNDDPNVIMTYNTKAPIGVKVGNSIVFAGSLTNHSESLIYTYTLEVSNSGKDYRVGDELYLPVTDGLIFKIIVTSTDQRGGIPRTNFKLVGPKTSSVPLPATTTYVTAVYDSRSILKYGSEARFMITQTVQPRYDWTFQGVNAQSSWINKPLYCGYGDLAGKPTLEKTDSFLGWCTGPNSIQLALDLRNEASDATYGTTRYATDCEVRDAYKYIQASHQTALTPWTANNNYLLIQKPELDAQPGKKLTNPIQVNTFTHFNEILLGKGVSAPYTTSNNPYIEDPSISFYGMAFRAWYKDIAEYYKSDAYYLPGTLITFGKGSDEISIAETECNGVISTKPGYQLGEKTSELDLPVALVGRVPVMFDGNCFPHFGDNVYLSRIKKGCASTIENGKCIGKIIDKNITEDPLIECVVRIDF